MADDSTPPLTDADLRTEIELVGDLVVAAAESDGPLSQEEIDLILDVHGDGRPRGG